jgi:L-iditol 2-dehydrogenase
MFTECNLRTPLSLLLNPSLTTNQITRPGGKVLLIGMGNPIQTLPISAAALREVDLLGVFRYANTYPTGIDILTRIIASNDSGSGDKKLPDVRKLVTHRFKGLESIEDAFGMAGKAVDESGNLVIKVVVEMDGPDGGSEKASL